MNAFLFTGASLRCDMSSFGYVLEQDILNLAKGAAQNYAMTAILFGREESSVGRTLSITLTVIKKCLEK